VDHYNSKPLNHKVVDYYNVEQEQDKVAVDYYNAEQDYYNVEQDYYNVEQVDYKTATVDCNDCLGVRGRNRESNYLAKNKMRRSMCPSGNSETGTGKSEGSNYKFGTDPQASCCS